LRWKKENEALGRSINQKKQLKFMSQVEKFLQVKGLTFKYQLIRVLWSYYDKSRGWSAMPPSP